jgi:hypothetical protein
MALPLLGYTHFVAVEKSKNQNLMWNGWKSKPRNIYFAVNDTGIVKTHGTIETLGLDPVDDEANKNTINDAIQKLVDRRATPQYMDNGRDITATLPFKKNVLLIGMAKNPSDSYYTGHIVTWIEVSEIGLYTFRYNITKNKIVDLQLVPQTRPNTTPPPSSSAPTSTTNTISPTAPESVNNLLQLITASPLQRAGSKGGRKTQKKRKTQPKKKPKKKSVRKTSKK